MGNIVVVGQLRHHRGRMASDQLDPVAAEREVRNVNFDFPEVEFSTWAVCERLLPQAQACAELIVEWGFELAEAARLLKEAGFYLFQRSRYAEAGPLCEQAVAIWERALGPEHPDVAWSLLSLAGLYRVQSRYPEAEVLFRRTLAIWEKARGPEHPDVAHSLGGLALLYYDEGRYAEAEPLYRRAVAIRERARWAPSTPT